MASLTAAEKRDEGRAAMFRRSHQWPEIYDATADGMRRATQDDIDLLYQRIGEMRARIAFYDEFLSRLHVTVQVERALSDA